MDKPPEMYLVVYYTIMKTDMKKTKEAGLMVAKLRKIIDKSQSQFAAMLGVSKDTFVSVENGRNKLSWNLARRIYIATGANLSKEVLRVTQTPGENYFQKDFIKWRSSYYPVTLQTAKNQFDRMQFWVETVFKAAAKPGLAGNRDRLPAVHLSLVEWLENARNDFKLETEIDEVLEEQSRHVGQERFPIWALKTTRNNFDEAHLRELASRLGVQYGPFKRVLAKRDDLDVLIIEDEFRRDWVDMFSLSDPLEEQTYLKTPCKERKLTTKPKYWFGKEDTKGNPIE
jgi:DNA-binding XRE family transcriptional regulator